jgi:glutathione S-transferase
MGYAGHCRISQRNPPRRQAAAADPPPGALPLGVRRNAFGLLGPARGAADESEGHFPNFKVWSRAEADIVRITTIWKECLAKYGGPFLFGEQRTMADAMYAPVVTRFMTYDVKLDPICTAYAKRIMAMPEMQQWITAAKKEPEDIDELDVEF